jgi:amino acid permease
MASKELSLFWSKSVTYLAVSGEFIDENFSNWRGWLYWFSPSQKTTGVRQPGVWG